MDLIDNEIGRCPTQGRLSAPPEVGQHVTIQKSGNNLPTLFSPTRRMTPRGLTGSDR